MGRQKNIGIVEDWKTGMVEDWNIGNPLKSVFQHSIIPIFHHSTIPVFRPSNSIICDIRLFQYSMSNHMRCNE